MLAIQLNQGSSEYEIENISKMSVDSKSSEILTDLLVQLLEDPSPVIQTASLYALVELNYQQGLKEAKRLVAQSQLDDLVRATATVLLDRSQSSVSVLNKIISLSQSAV